MLNPDDTVASRYRIVRLLSGRETKRKALYLAEDLQGAPYPCALLEIVDDFANPDQRRWAIAEFTREARALQGLSNDHIPAIYDFFHKGNRHYLVSEYVDGMSLEEKFEAALGPSDESTVVDIAFQILDALTYLHGQKPPIIHRNLKSSNIIVKPDGCVVLVNFAVARVFLPPEETFSDTGGYTPPFDEEVVPSTDLYALGVIIHQLLSRFDPRARSIGNEFPPSLSHLRPDLNPQLCDLIEHHVLRSLDGRVASATEFRRQLEDAQVPRGLIDNAQFTVYRPRAVGCGVWTSMLVFAHPSERPTDASDDQLDPIEEIRRQAEHILGDQISEYAQITQDSRRSIPRFYEISFVPEVRGFTFNPRQRTFMWTENVHREEFRMRASLALAGQTARGRLTVLLGGIVIAEVGLAIRVETNPRVRERQEPLESNSAKSYRKIFASYSHSDSAIVEQYERFARTFGDEYLRDVTRLRAGEAWSPAVQAMIRAADIFQLFWSTNSMRSRFVRQEWEFALALQRMNFIRPTYWEVPLPQSPDEGLPPEELKRLHFYQIEGLLQHSPTSVAFSPSGSATESAIGAAPTLVTASKQSSQEITSPSIDHWPKAASLMRETRLKVIVWVGIVALIATAILWLATR